MNPLIPIIAQYGLEFAIELIKLLEEKTVPSSKDFQDLKLKYASKKADDYLNLAQLKLPSV